MDHATRHLSSPSPTSPFLFHHSERSYKSSPDLLTPLLSSETEDNNVNACFSASTANEYKTIENFSSNHSDEDSRTRYLDHQPDIDTHQPDPTLSSGAGQDDTEDGVPLILGQFSADENSENHSVEANLSNIDGSGGCHHSESNKMDANIDDDDDDDDEDDENMRNVLSNSSRSSATTMPLLTDAHAHHSFSERISLGEYSPLSLVNDCDNALPMSPTSLACGSHHSSFKSSLNNIKIDHLGVDEVGHVGVSGVDDVVGDTRSMSPSLLSSSSHHDNLWSNSSTAITQNPSLLTSTSTSILLSQHSHHPNQHSHHHHNHQQISSLMQQLEPQSLDESPTLIGNNHHGVNTSTLVSNLNVSQPAQLLLHRPSSEPPLNIVGTGIATNDIGTKDICSFASSSLSSATIKMSPSSGRRVRKQSPNISSAGTSSSKSLSTPGVSFTTISNRSNKSRGARSRARSTKLDPASACNVNVTNESLEKIKPHSSKLHLQLNHHKKLKELQQRLFGNSTLTSDTNDNETKNANNCVEVKSGLEEKFSQLRDSKNSLDQEKFNNGSQEEADSSGGGDIAATVAEETIASTIHSKGTMFKSSPQVNKRKRPSRISASNKSSSTSSQNPETQLETRSNQKTVKTETAEPDTTTRSSECLKLADLLASSNGVEFARANGNFGIVLGADSIDRVNGNDCNSNRERNIQHIQLQMNPSLTVVANNNGLIQPINIQQHQLQLSNNEGAIAASSNNISNNQLTRQCQANNSMNPLSGVDHNSNNTNGSLARTQFKCNIVSNSETNLSSDKRGNNEEESRSWSSNNNNQCNSSGTNNSVNMSIASSGTATIGAHQIAIQVICQDGTSLVLPVSTATGLNAAVALSAQNQAQLQAILSNNGQSSLLFSNCQQSQKTNGTHQIFPVVTMINTQNQASIVGTSNSNNSNSSQTSANIGSTTSGLAASSPTLAALLDAGSNRNSTLSTNSSSELQQGQNLISGNILRKIVATTSTIQNHTVIGGDSSGSSSDLGSVTKRIKIEANNETGGNIRAATYTLIDQQGLIVTNGNENNNSNDSNNNGNCSDMTSRAESVAKRNVTKISAPGHQLSTNDCTDSIQQQQQKTNVGTSCSSGGNRSKANHECSVNKQIIKMTSSTGNRQVDPAQPFRCEHCNSTFTRLGNFTRHKKIHTVPTKDGQRFKCDVCSKSFLQRCDLARHLHIHRGTEPHRCNICGKGYIRHSDLVTHQRFHNKEKPFGCPHCSKGFCQRGDLNRHLRSIHLQMKPILCPCCNRKFAKQETLLRHLNTAHRGSNKPAGTSGSSFQTVIAELPSNFQVTTQVNNKKQQDLTSVSKNVNLVTNGETIVGTINNNNDNCDDNHSSTNGKAGNQKITAAVPVASLQAIQATLCKVQQSTDVSKKIKVVVSTSDGSVSNDKAIS